jgi:hypothetical protein
MLNSLCIVVRQVHDAQGLHSIPRQLLNTQSPAPRLLEQAASLTAATASQIPRASVVLPQKSEAERKKQRHRRTQMTRSRQSDFAATYLSVLKSKGITHGRESVPELPSPYQINQTPDSRGVEEEPLPALPSPPLDPQQNERRRTCGSWLRQTACALRLFTSSSACLQCFGGDLPSPQKPLSMLPQPRLVMQQPRPVADPEITRRTSAVNRTHLATLQKDLQGAGQHASQDGLPSAPIMANLPSGAQAGRRVLPGTMTTSRSLSRKKSKTPLGPISGPVPGSFKHSGVPLVPPKDPDQPASSIGSETDRRTMWPQLRQTSL